MKRAIHCALTLILVSALMLMGCGGGGGGGSDTRAVETSSLEDWLAEDAVWPAWAAEEEPPTYTATQNLPLTIVQTYTAALVSYEGTVSGIKHFRYILNNLAEDQDMQYFSTLILGTLLETVREDQLAAKLIYEVKETGVSELTISIDFGEGQGAVDYTLELAELYNLPLLGIYSRNGFVDEMEAAIAELDADEDHKPADHLIAIAKAYLMADMADKALERLADVDDETQYSYPVKMSSTAAGAASIYFRLGEYDKVLESTQWMIDEGYASGTFIDNPQHATNYFEDQWRSSYTLVEEWRKLAENGIAPSFTGLTDGVYTVTAQGYRGPIQVDVTIEGGTLSAAAAGTNMEDRGYSALKVVPDEWVAQQNMLVDGISGATVTSGTMEIAMIKALLRAGGQYDAEDIFVADQVAAWKQADLKWPAWAAAEAPPFEIEDVFSAWNQIFAPASLSEDNMRSAVKQMRYLAENYPDDPMINMVRLATAYLATPLGEDHLAFQMVEEIKATGETETDAFGSPFHYDGIYLSLLTNIYGRQGFIEDLETVIQEIEDHIAAEEDHGEADMWAPRANAHWLNDMDEELDRLFAMVGDETKYAYERQMASDTVGAASILFRQGKYDEVLSITQWMVDEGIGSTRFIDAAPEDSAYQYQLDHWQGSFRVVEEFRALAQDATVPAFHDLTDGVYDVTVPGFRGPIDVSVTIEDGHMEDVEVTSHMEDRAFNALTTVPDKWIKAGTMKVDGITGATVTAVAMEAAMIKALLQAAPDAD